MKHQNTDQVTKDYQKWSNSYEKKRNGTSRYEIGKCQKKNKHVAKQFSRI